MGPGDGVLREGSAAALNQGPDKQTLALDTTNPLPCGQCESLTPVKGGR